MVRSCGVVLAFYFVLRSQTNFIVYICLMTLWCFSEGVQYILWCFSEGVQYILFLFLVVFFVFFFFFFFFQITFV